jgi:hypothetical protein
MHIPRKVFAQQQVSPTPHLEKMSHLVGPGGGEGGGRGGFSPVFVGYEANMLIPQTPLGLL